MGCIHGYAAGRAAYIWQAAFGLDHEKCSQYVPNPQPLQAWGVETADWDGRAG